jgi:hypothetical protein
VGARPLPGGGAASVGVSSSAGLVVPFPGQLWKLSFEHGPPASQHFCELCQCFLPLEPCLQAFVVVVLVTLSIRSYFSPRLALNYDPPDLSLPSS